MAGGVIYRGPKKRGRKKKKPSTAVSKLTKKVNMLIGQIEKKHIDKALSYAVGSDATVNNLSTCLQGETSSTRNGLKIYARSVVIKGYVGWKSTASQETRVRIIVFVDRNADGAKPTLDDLLEGSTNTISLYNNINIGTRFQILKDITISNSNPNTTVGKETPFQIRLSLKKQIYYLDSTVNDSSLGRNHLHMVGISDVTTASADTPQLTFDSRVYFDDL